MSVGEVSTLFPTLVVGKELQCIHSFESNKQKLNKTNVIALVSVAVA